MARQKLILDVDTGTDDAIALMLAVRHPDLELVGVTTVNGNNPVDACTDNTLRVLDLLGAEVPVHEGAVSPLLRDDFPIPRALLHRDGSMHPRELPLPRPRSAKADGRAAEFLVETYMAATEPITLVPVGPLTNIALAIRLEPRIVERIPRTVIMGGAHELGNVTPSAEFNVWVDPDAARIVLRAGLPDVVLVPLDATHRALVSSADCARLRDTGTPAGRAAADIIEDRIAAYDRLQPMETAGAAPVHDALCIAYLVDRDVVSGRPAHVDVETRGGQTLGRTVVDSLGRFGREPNAFVAFDADAPPVRRATAGDPRPVSVASRAWSPPPGRRGPRRACCRRAQLLERDVAAHQVARLDLGQRWLGDLAQARDHARAAGVEHAARRRVGRDSGSRPRAGCASGPRRRGWAPRTAGPRCTGGSGP